MQFITIIAALLATAAASAIPSLESRQLEARQMPMACPAGLMSSPNCCATVILGVIGLDCTVGTISHHTYYLYSLHFVY